MSDSVGRFSDRVENYVKYRPGYPPEVLDLFRREMGLTPESIIADIGSGTGISSRLFLENGNTVCGVEPNDAMRAAAEELLRAFPNFKSFEGSAEYTTLPDASVNIVVAAQAFHWFDPEKFRDEIVRILVPGGYAALMWNERQLDTTPFLRDYERLLLTFGTDYETVRHENVTKSTLKNFIGLEFSKESFENVQVFDFEGIKGRLCSSSYTPPPDDNRFEPMIAELRRLFDKHEEGGTIKVFYDTNIFYTRI